LKQFQIKTVLLDRGRPARTAPQARSWLEKTFSRFALIAGETPAVPSKQLTRASNVKGR
jgi:hypothetical protein